MSSRRRNTRLPVGSRTRPGYKPSVGGTARNGASRRDPCPETRRNPSSRISSSSSPMVSHASLHSCLIRSTVRLRDNRRTGATGSLGRLPDIVVSPHGSRGRDATRY